MVVLPTFVNHFHGHVAIGAVRIKRFRGAFAGTTPPVWIAKILLLVNLSWLKRSRFPTFGTDVRSGKSRY